VLQLIQYIFWGLILMYLGYFLATILIWVCNTIYDLVMQPDERQPGSYKAYVKLHHSSPHQLKEQQFRLKMFAGIIGVLLMMAFMLGQIS
jgi:hypothetical protein